MNWNLGPKQIFTILDLFNCYFSIVEAFFEENDSIELLKYSIQKCRYFGQYLCNLIIFYPKCMFKYGFNLLACCVIYITLKICQFPLTWTSFLKETSGVSIIQMKEPSKKICQKFIDLTFNERKGKDRETPKIQRLELTKFKYESDKYE